MDVRINYLDFEIDKLTESIECTSTGKSYATNVSLVLLSDLKQITKKNGWLFNWKIELSAPEREVYKLTVQEDPTIIQGVMSISMREGYVYMNLIESAPSNRGKNKVYLGVLGNLVAFSCRLSFHRGFNGYLAFHSKTKLIDHYRKNLGACHSGGHLMVIDQVQAKILIDKYFKE